MKKYILSALLVFALVGCESDYLEVKKETGFSGEQMEALRTSPEMALKLFSGIEGGNYQYMMSFQSGGTTNHRDFGLKGFDIGLDMMSGDIAEVLSTNMWSPYAEYRGRIETGDIAYSLWYYHTKVASAMNNILGTIDENSQNKEIRYTVGRVRGMRGLANLNLIRLYGVDGKGIPLVDKEESFLARLPINEVNDFIEKDLLAAYDYLQGYARESKDYLDQKVIAGFLTRYYLYVEDYANVVKYADLAVGDGVTNFDVINDGFSDINNPEWIWGFGVDVSTSSLFASYFSWMDNHYNAGYGQIYGGMQAIDANLYAQIPETDKRKKWFAREPIPADNEWGLTQYTNYKYQDKSGKFLGDYLYMRKTEIQFNKIEALHKLGKDNEALTLLKAIVTTRDPGFNFTGSGEALFNEIKFQKRVEFWAEGFAFYDAKRWKRDVIRSYPGTNHLPQSSFDVKHPDPRWTFQFPVEETRANTALEQNPS